MTEHVIVPCKVCISLAACQTRYHEDIASSFSLGETLIYLCAMEEMAKGCPYLRKYIDEYITCVNGYGYTWWDTSLLNDFNDFLDNYGKKEDSM